MRLFAREFTDSVSFSGDLRSQMKIKILSSNRYTNLYYISISGTEISPIFGTEISPINLGFF